MREQVLDFSNDFVRNAFEITVHTGESAKTVSQYTDNSSYLFDNSVNEHNAPASPPDFASIIIFDPPNRNPISVLSLAELHMDGLPQKVFGSATEIAQKTQINQLADRYLPRRPTKIQRSFVKIRFYKGREVKFQTKRGTKI